MKRVVTDAIQCLKPRYLHIGHDEPRFINRDSRCRALHLATTQLFTDDINRIHDWAEEIDPRVRLMMWSDALIAEPDGTVQLAWHTKETDSLDEVTKRIPKDILLCAWEYSGTDPGYHEFLLASLADRGYEVTASPWFTLGNVASWAEASRRLRAKGKPLLGIFLTTWDDRWEADAAVAEYNWSLSDPPFVPGPGQEQAMKDYFSRF